MTDPKLVTRAQRLDPANQADLDEFFNRSKDVENLIDLGPLTVQSGKVISADDMELASAVALAIVKENMQDHPDIFRALASVGCTPEMYEQLASTEDFPKLLRRKALVYIALPRMGGLVNALVNAARSGDVRSSNSLFAMIEAEAVEDDFRALVKSLREDPSQAEVMLARMQREFGSLYRQLEEVEPDPEVLAEAKGMVHSVYKPPRTSEGRIDPADLQAG